MFRKILVALDDSPLRAKVFEKALSLAAALDAQLMLLHVLSAYSSGSPGIPLRAYPAYYPILDDTSWQLYQERWHLFEMAGIERLQRDLATATAAGVNAEFTQSGGEPSLVICDLARSWEADLIIVGSHGRSGLSELLMGSVSNYVMHHAPCSVLVVHSQRTKTARSNGSGIAETTVSR
ncbi:MAG: universal stress protein [Cyanobacteria bacterium Co-bin13]|nr:universal stress protein [Cyanobacteria bacterium Co-bin13]